MTENESSKKRIQGNGIVRQGEHPYGDRGQIVFLIVFLAIWILDSFVFRYSTGLSSYVPIYLRLIFACLILMVALYLAASGHRAVSDETISSSRLLTDGAFARVRHPLYLASLLFYVFLIVLTLSLLSIAVFVGIFIFYDYISAYEEKYLVHKFGQDYLDYKKNTPKWVLSLRL